MIRASCHVVVLAGTVVLLMGADQNAIKPGDSVVFFPTFAHLDGDGQSWLVPVHGWIYEPRTGSKRRMLLGGLRRALHLEPEAEESALFQERVRLFLGDNQPKRRVGIRLGDRIERLDPSAANGHFTGAIYLSAAEAAALLQNNPAGWVEFAAVTGANDGRAFRGQVQLLAPAGYSVISDIDDTIRISEVRNRRALLSRTFRREFEAVPGMAELYREWARAGASFHYVSASPWQLYAPLADFVQQSGFPAGSFHLKYFRWKDSTFFQLLTAPDKYKPPVIRPLLETFPARKFILVGDSGEKDPEVYGALARQYPAQIVRILIHDVSGDEPDGDRYRECFADLPRQRWTIFREPSEVERKLP